MFKTHGARIQNINKIMKVSRGGIIHNKRVDLASEGKIEDIFEGVYEDGRVNLARFVI